MDGFGESIPKKEQELEDGVAREDAQHQDVHGRSGALSHEAHIDQG